MNRIAKILLAATALGLLVDEADAGGSAQLGGHQFQARADRVPGHLDRGHRHPHQPRLVPQLQDLLTGGCDEVDDGDGAAAGRLRDRLE
jgi:hypothetical protein